MTSPAAAARQAVGSRPGSDATAAWEAPDARRRLQLALAALWLLDGVLQYQPVMFTRAFGRMLAGAAAGNPTVIADPITWSARVVAHNPTATNAAFATIQLALGLGIAWRRSVRVALAASIAWSLAVWWLGEGFGGVLTAGASPVTGAPGAVILYALLAVLLWPAAGGGGSGSFVAARPVGARAARATWLVLWGSLAYFAVQAGNRTAHGLHDVIATMAGGEPAWLASIDQDAAAVLAHHGLLASVVLSAVLAAIAAGIFLPAPAVRVTVAAALVVSAVIWVVGQNLGGILAGGATDVNSGPLLMLIALAYWPLGAGRPGRAAAQADPAGAVRGAVR